MNLANEMDLAMDEAVKRRIGHLFDHVLHVNGASGD